MVPHSGGVRPIRQPVRRWKAEPRSEPAPDDSPVYNCRDGLDATDVVFCAIEIVAVNDDKVGELAGLKGTPGLFSELKIRRPNGPHFQGFLPRDPLLRVDHL